MNKHLMNKGCKKSLDKKRKKNKPRNFTIFCTLYRKGKQEGRYIDR